MILSDNYTWIPVRRVAVLTLPIAQRLIDKYNISESGGDFEVNVQGVLKVNNHIKSYLHANFKGKEDLITEWFMSSINRGSGRWGLEDIPRLLDAAHFYFDNYKTDKFKRVVQEFGEQNHERYNPKNILDFTLHEMEEVQRLFEETHDDPKVNELQKNLPEGARQFYDGDGYQIIEVTNTQAACQLAKGTSWCTKREEAATHYLSMGPLYIIYKAGKKVAQFHVGSSIREIQLMDLKDNEISPDRAMENILIKSGLMNGVWDMLGNDSNELDDKSIVFNTFLVNADRGYLVNKCSTKPVLAYLYLVSVQDSSEPLENLVAQDGRLSALYGMYVIHDRFILGEPAMIRDNVWGKYVDFLFQVGKGNQFVKDHPELLKELEESQERGRV